MPVRRQYAPRSIDAACLGRAEPYYQPAIVRLLAAHATAEKLIALGYARAIASVTGPPLAPVLKENLARVRKHAALLCRVLEELGVSEKSAGRLMIPIVKKPSFEAPRYFAERACGELDFVMAMLALDGTGLLMIGINYRESSYAPHSRAAELILDEEGDHEIFASRLLELALERFGAEAVTAALRSWLPRAVNYFGPPGSGFTYECLRYGLKVRDNQELAELYLTILERRAAQLGLELPALTAGYPRAAA